jgi:hypothetical protein
MDQRGTIQGKGEQDAKDKLTGQLSGQQTMEGL